VIGELYQNNEKSKGPLAWVQSTLTSLLDTSCSRFIISPADVFGNISTIFRVYMVGLVGKGDVEAFAVLLGRFPLGGI
jgi:hypothetical protein